MKYILLKEHKSNEGYDIEIYVCRSKEFRDYYVGYVIANKLIPENIWKAFDVHGGITYDRIAKNTLTLGFDTGNLNDNCSNINNIDYVINECNKLSRLIFNSPEIKYDESARKKKSKENKTRHI